MRVKNEVFYHIHVLGKKNDALWREGSQFHIGKDINYFYEYYETSKIGIHFNKGYMDTSIGIEFAPGETIPIRKALEVLNKLPSELKDQVGKVWLQQALKAIKEMSQYIREVIFEEVRIAKFHDRPSRKTCIWLTDEENLQTWLQRTHAGEKEVFKLLVSGNIHMADEKHLIADTLSHKEFRLNAEKYWSGENVEGAALKEILFEGSVTVLERVDQSLVADY